MMSGSPGKSLERALRRAANAAAFLMGGVALAACGFHSRSMKSTSALGAGMSWEACFGGVWGVSGFISMARSSTQGVGAFKPAEEVRDGHLDPQRPGSGGERLEPHLREQLELERHPPALGADRQHRPPRLARGELLEGPGRLRMRGEAAGRAERLVELVLGEGAEALADEHLGRSGVARLLEAEREQLVDDARIQDLRVEVALLDARGVDQDELVDPERGRGGEDLL